MIDTTERVLAERQIDNIKNALKSSNVDYCLSETPFSLHIQLKKRFLKDNSPKLIQHRSLNETSALGSSPTCVPCKSSEGHLKKLEDLVQNLTEQNVKLEESNSEKEKTINQLESKVNDAIEENKRIKIERNTKNNQLKKKNKDLEKALSDLKLAQDSNKDSSKDKKPRK